jgi:HD-GYP domain-containing protein (c-di-GMP phosphodiesterase class II)/DNA-binding CsgD family transcriptional regulator
MGPLLRLADLLASLSMVSDLGFALPPEAAMRRCVIATALAQQLDLPPAQVQDIFYTALLQHIGCTGFAHESWLAYGDEMVVNAELARSDPVDLADAIAFARSVTAGRPLPEQLGRVVFTLARGGSWGRGFATATCEVGRETARQLGLGDGVSRGLEDAVERWDGRSGARGLRGEDISLAARVTAVAYTASVASELPATDAVRSTMREQSGRVLDPDIVSVFLAHEDEILGEARGRDPVDAVLEAEPAPVRTIPGPELAAVAAAIGHVADLKSTFTLGHSSGVAALAVASARRMGLDGEAVGSLEVAGLLHDVGRVGISNAIWQRPGPLTQSEWEQVRLHAYHSERILTRSGSLREVAPLVGMHHERMDGSGYHRGVRGSSLPFGARLLAAADALDAMTHDRPHRRALTPEEAVRALSDDVHVGRLDAEAVGAVVDAAELVSAVRPPRVQRAAGLSEREVEVLRLMARGLSNRQIAERLVVSTRTAEHHVQHVYAKIGVSSRAAAALFAMENALLD